MTSRTVRATGVRLFELDVARGLAMLLVCLAHFLDMYVLGDVSPHNAFIDALMLMCRVAAPAFVLISGVLLGYQAEARAAQFDTFRIHLLDRALFLLTIGHLAISWAFAARFGFARALAWGQITDTLAFCMLVGVYVVPVMSKRLRLLSGLSLSVGSCLLWPVWSPADPFLRLLKSILIGPVPGDPMVFLFPLLPWLGLYISGTAVGASLKGASSAGASAIRRFPTVSIAIIMGVLGVKAGLTLWAAPEYSWWGYISVHQKYPPGLLYLGLYGGAGLLLISLLFAAGSLSRIRKGMALVEPIGRNALPIFILQFFVYYTGFYLLVTTVGGVTPWLAAVSWMMSLVALWGCAKACEHYHLSKFMTAGLPRVISAQRQDAGEIGCNPLDRSLA